MASYNCSNEFSVALRKKWSQNGSSLERFFSLIIMFRKKMAPPSEVAPFCQYYCYEVAFQSGAKIVPRVELSYVP